MTENEELATYGGWLRWRANPRRLCFMCHELDHDGPCLPLDVRQSGALGKIPVRSS
jgi:hypothetical protein